MAAAPKPRRCSDGSTPRAARYQWDSMGAIALQTLEDLAPALGHGKPLDEDGAELLPEGGWRQRPALGRRRQQDAGETRTVPNAERERASLDDGHQAAHSGPVAAQAALRRGPRADGGHVQRVVAERAREEIRRQRSLLAREPFDPCVRDLVTHGSRCGLGGGILHRRRGCPGSGSLLRGDLAGPACGLLHRALRSNRLLEPRQQAERLLLGVLRELAPTLLATRLETPELAARVAQQPRRLAAPSR